jgi:hypothetical protein
LKSLTRRRFPHRRQVERGDEGGKQSDVAHADLRRAQAIVRRRFEAQRQHFRIGRRLVGAAERFDAGLHELRRGAFAVAEYGAEIAKAHRLAGLGRREVVARHRDGEIGPQAQFAPFRIAGQEHAAADVLAGQVEERLRRLQHRRFGLRVAGTHIGGDERLRPHVRSVAGGARHVALQRRLVCFQPPAQSLLCWAAL